MYIMWFARRMSAEFHRTQCVADGGFLHPFSEIGSRPRQLHTQRTRHGCLGLG